MLICYSKIDNKIEKVILGNNPIAPYSENIESIFVNNDSILIKRGDKVHIDEENNVVKIGFLKLQLNDKKATKITEKNCDGPIFLEELT